MGGCRHSGLHSAAGREEQGMAFDFELYDRRLAPRSSAPTVTITRRGMLSLSRAAHDLIGRADAVELLYDRTNHLVAVRAADPESTTAFALRPASTDRPASPLTTTATSFFTYYRIDTTVSRRWTPESHDNMLIVNLDGPSVEVRRGSGKEVDEDD